MDSQDVLKQYEGYYTIGMVQSKLKEMGADIPIPTIRNWANELHQLQVHTLNRSSLRGERIFNELDLEIIKFIYDAKKRFGNSMTMVAICTMIQEQDRFKQHLSYNPTDSDVNVSESGVPVIAEHKLREYLRDELKEISSLKSELNELIKNYQDQILLLPNYEEEREQRKKDTEELLTMALNDTKLLVEQKRTRELETRTAIVNGKIEERRIIAKLRKKAEDEWSRNPVKTGLFIKKEDQAAKLLFIEKYIDEHLEEAYKEIEK